MIKQVNIDEIVEKARKTAVEIFKKYVKKGEQLYFIKKTLKTLIEVPGKKIVHVDVDMMYPTKIKNEKIDPCCLVLKTETPTEMAIESEDAEYELTLNICPFYSFISRLYEVRLWAKKTSKMYKELAKKEADPSKKQEYERLERMYKLFSDLVKPIINSAYGAMSKSTGYVHLAHAVSAGKIFNSTIIDLLTLMIASRMLGYTPLYGDTDSLFVLAPADEPDEEVVKKLSEVASKLGYTISHEGTYSYMYIYAKKSYAVGVPGSFIKMKGQLLAKLKHITSPMVRYTVLEALKNRTAKVLVENIEQIDDPILLIPSLSKQLRDLVLKPIEDLKRKLRETEENEEEENEEPEIDEVDYAEIRNRREPSLRYLKVTIFCKGEYKDRTGYLKSQNPGSITNARLSALALTYGEEAESGSKIINFSKYSITYIFDLRALPVITSSERLSGDRSLVLSMDSSSGKRDMYIASVDISKSYYVLTDREEERYLLPVRYLTSNTAKIQAIMPDKKKTVSLDQLRLRNLMLIGMQIAVNVHRKINSIDEAKLYVLDVIVKYLKWTGLDKLLPDLYTVYAKVSREMEQFIVV